MSVICYNGKYVTPYGMVWCGVGASQGGGAAWYMGFPFVIAGPSGPNGLLSFQTWAFLVSWKIIHFILAEHTLSSVYCLHCSKRVTFVHVFSSKKITFLVKNFVGW